LEASTTLGARKCEEGLVGGVVTRKAGEIGPIGTGSLGLRGNLALACEVDADEFKGGGAALGTRQSTRDFEPVASRAVSDTSECLRSEKTGQLEFLQKKAGVI
jgi:hypothetical protein